MQVRILGLAAGAITAGFLFLVSVEAPASSSDYVGSETCSTCHEEEYAVWRRSPHARATRSLPSAFRRDPKCASCHATDAKGTLSGVGCESCHGAGRYYYPSYVMKDPIAAEAMGLVAAGEATCKRCHGPDAPSLRPFVYKDAWKRIAHGPKATPK